MTGLVLALLLAQQPPAEDFCTRAVVYLESRGEPLRGQKAVRQTLKNRARKNGTDTCTEAKRKGQFSSVKKGMKLKNVKVSRKFLTDYEKLRMMSPVVPSCTTYFHAKSVEPSWAKSKRLVAVVHNHKFYC